MFYAGHKRGHPFPSIKNIQRDRRNKGKMSSSKNFPEKTGSGENLANGQRKKG
jgi:hypothetical protein